MITNIYKTNLQKISTEVLTFWDHQNEYYHPHHKFNINGVIATINIINKAIINILIFIFVSTTSSFFLNIDNQLYEKGRQIGAVALSQISEARPSIVEAEPCELSHQTRF